MADPNPYDPSYSFSGFQASNPSKPLPAPRVDDELANISAAIGTLLDAVKDVRRSDGALKNGIVSLDSLAPVVRSGLGEGALAAAASALASSVAAAGSAAAAAEDREQTGEDRAQAAASAGQANASAGSAAASAAAAAGALVSALKKDQNLGDLINPALAFNIIFLSPVDAAEQNLNTLTTPGRYRVSGAATNLPQAGVGGVVTVSQSNGVSSNRRQVFEPSLNVASADTTNVSVARTSVRYVASDGSTASKWLPSNDMSAVSLVEIGSAFAGDRPAGIDLHASGAAGALDYSARLIRQAGVNGALDITQTGTGNIEIQGGGELRRNGEKVMTEVTGRVRNPAPVGQTFQQVNGAIVHRQDRIFAGKFIAADGNFYAGPQTGPFPADPLGNTHAAQVASWSTIGHTAILGFSRGVDNVVNTSLGIIGGGFRVYNDNPTLQQGAFAIYADAVREAGRGFTTALEVDIVNKGNTYELTPTTGFNATNAPITSAIWVAAGAEIAANPSSAGIAMVSNGSKFHRGIVFENNSLFVFPNGLRDAVVLGQKSAVAFFNADGVKIGNMYADTIGTSVNAVFADAAFEIQNLAGGVMLKVGADAVLSLPNSAIAATAGTSHGYITIGTSAGPKKIQVFNV